MIYTGKIQDGRLTLPNVQRESRKLFLSSMPSGTLIKETIVKISPNKTHKQIKTIFGLVLTMIVEEFNNNGWDSSMILNLSKPTGVEISKNLLKEYFYAVCPISDDEGNNVTLSSASIEQARKFIDNVRNFAVSQWGINIPDPDPNWRNRHLSET